MLKPLLIFGVSKPAVYSYASLLGSIEINKEVLEKYDIKIKRMNFLKEIKNINDFVENLHYSERPFVIFPISLYTSQINDFHNFIQKIIRLLKEINENTIVIAGGWHSTGAP